MSLFGSQSATGVDGSMNPENHFVVPSVPKDGISSLSFSPAINTTNILAAGCWDNSVSVWEVVETNGSVTSATPRSQVSADGPVLCTDITTDGRAVVMGGCDKTVKVWQLGQTSTTVVGQHDGVVKCVKWVNELNMIVSASWDGTARFWDVRQPSTQCACTLTIQEKCYAMDILHPLMVVATGNKRVIAYDLTNQPREFKRMDNVLSYQSRCIACFPDRTGFALGSIEGRVSIRHVKSDLVKRDFTFRCHRETPNGTGSNNPTNVYSVNSICFHRFGTFATVGSDGICYFWDKENRTRLRAYKKCNQTISTAAFSASGTLFAYAVSYDWSKVSKLDNTVVMIYLTKGAENYNQNMASNILIGYCRDDDMRAKGKLGGKTL